MSHNTKPFRTIEQQINILVERGLKIDDRTEAAHILSCYNYYRLSGYTLTLRRDDRFSNGTSLNDVMQIYNFDAELRSLLLYELEYIEVSIRTHIGYYHAQQYGPLGYLKSNSFIDCERYIKFKQDVDEAIKEQSDREVFVKHHLDNCDGEFPIWVIVELLSFGTLSRLFKNLNKAEVQDRICSEHYGLIKADYIENWLQGLTILRNICAHRGRIYNRNIHFSVKLSTKDKRLLTANELMIQKVSKQLFGYLFVMKKLIDDTNVWHSFMENFTALTKKYSFVDLKHYGFPENWTMLLN